MFFVKDCPKNLAKVPLLHRILGLFILFFQTMYLSVSNHIYHLINKVSFGKSYIAHEMPLREIRASKNMPLIIRMLCMKMAWYRYKLIGINICEAYKVEHVQIFVCVQKRKIV